MKKTRQDAWSEEEDKVLKEIVLQFIRAGKTQLEAFQHAGESLARTPAACGFRWNATIRKEYLAAIENAKKERNQHIRQQPYSTDSVREQTIDSVISILERAKSEPVDQHDGACQSHIRIIAKLTEENKQLHNEIKRYHEAWQEMGHLWQWIRESNQKRNEH